MNPTQPPAAAEAEELAFHALGFVVKCQAQWTASSLKQFRHFLSLRHFSPSEDELQTTLQQAKNNYLEGTNRLYLCSAQPCCTRIYIDLSEASLARLQEETLLTIVKTGCQGPCKQAPVMTLRVGGKQEMFGEVASEKDWRAVLKFATAAIQSGTLLVDTGDAEKLRFDPVHDHEKPSAHLKPLEFLLGRFRGEGRYMMADYAFQKELIGSFEAGGRFIALRMDASYPLADGRKDVHKALVIVGAAPSGDITAHAYTDGGIIREYSIAQHDGAIDFADTPPGHASQWKRARKILRPTEIGFEERLEVDDGGGTFKPYYAVTMQKVAD